jgi:Ca2+-binding EF-hand superfamily protein
MEEDEYLILRSVFDKYDKGRKGYLSKLEFVVLVRRLSKHIKSLQNVDMKGEISAVFNLFDINGDGVMTFEEFKKWWYDREKYSYFIGEKAELIKKAYSLYQHYASKELGMSLDELKYMLTEMGIDHKATDFEKLDTDGDGIFSFREFCDWLEWF